MTSDTQIESASESRNILFVYHRLDIIGGIETRWMDEFEALNKNKYKVFFLVPKQHCINEIAKLFSTYKLIKIDVDNINLAPEFIKLVNKIIRTIRANEIDVISIHMLDTFACAAIMAAQICRIPVISTVHGTPDIYRKPIERLLVQELAGRSFSLSVSVSQHLESIFKTKSPLVTVVPNLINLEKYVNEKINVKPAWLVVNRVSPEKYPSILRFLQAADECQISTVDIAGGGKPDNLRKLIDEMNIKLQVNFLGEVTDIANLISQYSGVAGMGRAAIEGLACQKPVCVMSPEGNLIGLVTKENFKALKDYNFTGKTLAPIDNKKFLIQLNTHTFEDSKYVYQQLKSELSIENWHKYIDLYQQVEFIDNQALEALYHKIAYFSVTLSNPFINDKFFQHLFYETLIEHDLNDIKKSWLFYEKNRGFNTYYPNPLKACISYKEKWRMIFRYSKFKTKELYNRYTIK